MADASEWRKLRIASTRAARSSTLTRAGPARRGYLATRATASASCAGVAFTDPDGNTVLFDPHVPKPN